MCQRAVERDDVALFKKLLGAYIFCALCRKFFRGVRVICQDIHSDALAYFSEFLTYFSCAYDACGLAVKVKACKTVYAEIIVSCAQV